ncbi:MAG: CHAT domain-containing protein [Planctomycetota bacterium]
MVELRLQLEREANKQTSDEDELARLQEELGARGADLEEIERRLRAKNPGLAEIVAPESASLADVKNALGPVEVLLWYVLGQQESFVWVITREGASIVKLPASVDIEARVKGLIGSLASGSKSLEFVPPARELYEMLLAKPLACCPEKGQLIIVPNGLLGFLPFEVLLGREVPQEERQRGRLPYLLREKTIRYAPSPSLFVFLHRHRRPEGGWAKDLLLFGDPVYAGEARATAAFANRASRSLLPESFSRLSKTRDEVKTLAESLVQDDESKLFLQLRDLKRSGCVSGKRFDLFVGEKASKSQLKGDLSRYRIVHLATHGYFDTRYPWFSGLVLSDVPDDLAGGFLSLSEIGELKLDADVVFLSACETAKGSLAHCEGILNTARYFLLAGARSVVATQWDVLDYAAPIVARVFYEHLFAGEAPGEALREAKLALIDERADIRGARSLGEGATNDAPSFSHPSVWAPFVIFGK